MILDYITAKELSKHGLNILSQETTARSACEVIAPSPINDFANVTCSSK
jgi:hypothetical protein